MQDFTVNTFELWRDAARRLVHAVLPPSVVTFMDSQGERTLWGHDVEEGLPDARPSSTISVPSSFLDVARQVACHRDRDRWNVLYRLLWRLTHGEPELMHVLTDDDVHDLVVRRRQVRRDVHRMHAFVRFRKCTSNDTEWFVAWYRPDHRILHLAVPFFVQRYKIMCWSILTPDESVMWNRDELLYGPGTACGAAPEGDALEQMWLTYYRSTYNPTRIKKRLLRAQIPLRFRPCLPETRAMGELLVGTPESVVELMKQRREGEQHPGDCG